MQRVKLLAFSLSLLLGASAQSPGDKEVTHKNAKLLPLNDCGVDSYSSLSPGNSTNLGAFPWTALLKFKTADDSLKFICGGTLISRRYVLTAAHCIKRSKNDTWEQKLVSVRLGEWDLDKDEDCINEGIWCSDPPLDMEVEEVITHPNYYGIALFNYNDIALVRLKGLAPDKSSFIKPICLPIGDDANILYPTGKKLIVSGWQLRKQSNSVKLKAVVSAADYIKCQNGYESLRLVITDTQLCAGGASDTTDYCLGDSGGPLTAYHNETERNVLAGIVSMGTSNSNCGPDGIPVIYTRISSFTTWILDNIRP